MESTYCHRKAVNGMGADSRGRKTLEILGLGSLLTQVREQQLPSLNCSV